MTVIDEPHHSARADEDAPDSPRRAQRRGDDPARPAVRSTATGADFRADALLAAGLLIAAVLSSALTSVAGFYGAEQADLTWALVYSVAVTAPLAARRRFPLTVAVVVCVLYFLAVSFRVPEIYIGNVAMFVAIYTIGAWVNDRRRAVIVRVLLIIGMFLWLVITTFQQATGPEDVGLDRAGAFSPFVAFMLIQFLTNAAYFGGAYYLGDRAYSGALQRASLQQRTHELEDEREVTAAQAVALDRVRIARELHDVVAHHVSAMGVQAGAARTVFDRDPAAARESLTQIEGSARSAIDELHNLLTTLRAPHDDDDAPSTVGLADLDALAERMTASGTPTTFQRVGEEVAVSNVAQVNLYRIAQEALTNARRHGGPQVTADMRLRYTPEIVELEVTNTGRSSLTARPGLGQLGMRERATASGGTLEVGPRERGGYRVRVQVPADPAWDGSADAGGADAARAARGPGATS